MQLRHAKAIVKRNEEAARLVVEAEAAEVAEAEKVDPVEEPVVEEPVIKKPVEPVNF